MKIVWLLIVLMLWPVVGNAQERAPNRRDVVEQVSVEDPARFACAHTERSCKNDWIIAVAQALHQTDARWGLNGKRGNANDLSMDVVTWRIGPTDRHVQAFDICGACGGANPQVVWSDITNWSTIGQPGTAVWIKPPQAVDPVDPQPVDDLTALLAIVQRLEAKLDAVAGVAVEARDQANDAKIVAQAAFIEAEQAKINSSDVRHVDIPRLLEQFKPSCVTGKVPKAFGGSATVTLCPQQ